MTFGTVCTGIDAASVAWSPLSWESRFSAEVDPFCCALLNDYWPDVPNHGDLAKAEIHESVDILIAGTPCQGFSAAGNRKGLDDSRSNLAMHFFRVVKDVRPTWVVWENVPGAFSTNKGRDFGAVLGALEECGYWWSYRVLDAQYFGLAQKRRRVFVVGHRRVECATAVLFERESLSGAPTPRRKETSKVAGAITAGLGRRRGSGLVDSATANHLVVPELATTLTAGTSIASNAPGRRREDDVNLVLHREKGFGLFEPDDITGPIRASGGKRVSDLFVFEPRVARNGRGAPSNVAPALRAENGSTGKGDGAPCVAMADEGGYRVRRLTVRECERLQGFPDDFTQIEGYRRKVKEHELEEMAAYWDLPLEQVRELGATSDSVRYRALGNSFPVPVIRWIGERIQLVEENL